MILILDTSGNVFLLVSYIILDAFTGSMSAENRLELAKNAAKAVVQTLTFADFVQVIEFNTLARNLAEDEGGPDHLIQASTDNKEMLIQAIDGLFHTGFTNFEAAFDMAFDNFAAGGAEYSSGCEKIILFLSGAYFFLCFYVPVCRIFLAEMYLIVLRWYPNASRCLWWGLCLSPGSRTERACFKKY